MRFLILLCLAAPAALPAAASTDEAWESFRAEVRDGCLAAAASLGTAVVEVNPWGSESHGAALVTLQTEAGEVERRVCIFDKRSKAVELTEPFGG